MYQLDNFPLEIASIATSGLQEANRINLRRNLKSAICNYR